MYAKLLAIIGSVRFWLITLAAVSAFLGVVQSQGFDWKILFDTIAIWLATVAGVGTVDKLSVKK